jgi:hypothetical protein
VVRRPVCVSVTTLAIDPSTGFESF